MLVISRLQAEETQENKYRSRGHKEMGTGKVHKLNKYKLWGDRNTIFSYKRGFCFVRGAHSPP